MIDDNSNNEENMLRKANELRDKSEHGQASQIYVALLDHDPDNVSLLLEAAHSIFWSDNWGSFDGTIDANIKKMFEFLERAVRLKPDDPDVRNDLASYLALYGRGDPRYAVAAARQIREALRLKPNHVPTLLLLSREYHAVQAGLTIDEAFAWYQQAADHSPHEYAVWESLGEFLDRVAPSWIKDAERIAQMKSHVHQAIEVYMKLIAMMPDGTSMSRRKYIEENCGKYRRMLSRIPEARSRLQRRISKIIQDSEGEEKPLLDLLGFTILDYQMDGKESLYLTYLAAKRCALEGVFRDSIIQSIIHLVNVGLSKCYDANDTPVDELVFEELSADLGIHSDKYLAVHSYRSEFYFEVTEAGRAELGKKIYSTYEKLRKISDTRSYYL